MDVVKRFFSIQFEDAAKELVDEITRPRPEGEEHVKNIQVMLRSEANPICIRQLAVSFLGYKMTKLAEF